MASPPARSRSRRTRSRRAPRSRGPTRADPSPATPHGDPSSTSVRPRLSCVSMADDHLPLRKIGHLSPQSVIENQPYEFYKLAPDRVMLASVAVGLKEFSRQDVERVVAPIEALTLQLVERHVDIVVWGGVPLPVLVGQEAHARVLDRIEKVGKVPATSTVLCVVEAAKGLG